MAGNTLYYDSKEFPILGRIYVATTEKGLCRLSLPGAPVEVFFQALLDEFKPGFFSQNPEPFQDLYRQIERYCDGWELNFDVPLDLRGTSFQLQVWEALRGISYGQTSTYGEIARTINRPRACRAVGQANHHNPLPIIIPCHRVIGTNGGLTGYGGGLPLKVQLLSIEKKGLGRVADKGAN
jgi:O-6-methylguanine DNA methyltransferase